ncbi:MAG: SDR family oxidoreductase [Pseudomonadota bacterium]
MAYFVTGATGFIGSRLVEKLLQRNNKSKVYFLVRENHMEKTEALFERWGVSKSRAVPIVGDLTQPLLGISKKDRDRLRGKVKHLFHLAAIYDLGASAEKQEAVNVDGTRNMVAFAEDIEAGCVHLTSSIAAAGLYNGVFREDMFDEAEGLDHPYYRTKHESEKVVRTECKVPWRVYRPGVVVGHSETGEIDKIDGPYYFFKAIQALRKAIPAWMPTVGIEGGRINIVPVDYVVDAMDYIAHKKGLDGKCFHLTDPDAKRIGDILNIFAHAGHAPAMTMRINASMFGFVPGYVWKGLAAFPPVKRMINATMEGLNMPPDVLKFVNYPTRFDSREAQKALKGSGISVPALQSYAWRLWDYWERNLDPDLFIDRSLSGKVAGRVVVVTGASSGIGKATAIKMAEAGAKVVMVARTEEKLLEARDEVAAAGGETHVYTCDVSDLDAADRVIDKIVEDLGSVDFLVNNAGRSIRRGVASSFDRFHDFERTMQLNYFGALRLIMRSLPHMMASRRGHVINISSIGVLSNAPRFSAYVASKAALDAFTRCAASEFSHMQIAFTTINMPLVRTPMIAPTKLYQNVPTISPEEAADMVVEAVVKQPKRIATRLGIFAQIAHLLAPKTMELGMNEAFRLFPDSAAARGDKGSESSPEQIALAQFTRGIHW